MKKIIIIASSVIALSLTVYFVHSSLSRASNSTPAYEHYYSEEDETNNQTSDATNAPVKIDETLETSIHSNATIIDTIPDSITVLVNKEYGLSSDFAPSDLVVPDVLFNSSYFEEKKLMRKEAAAALLELFQAAKDDGNTLYAISAYRSYKRQNEIYIRNLINKGVAHTNQYSAKPGYSEHQTGLSIDVSAASVGYRLEDIFADSKEGIWLAQNCYEYGFIIRYPKDKSEITGYSYEPWHIRYVGKDLAIYLYKNNLTLEEYYKYTPSKDFLESAQDNVVDVDPSDYNSKPTKTIKPTGSPSLSPSVSPSPSASPSTSPNSGDDKEEDPNEQTETPTKTKTPLETKKPLETKNPSDTTKPTTTKSPSPSPTIEPTLSPTKKPTDVDSTPTPTPTNDDSSNEEEPSSSSKPTTAPNP